MTNIWYSVIFTIGDIYLFVKNREKMKHTNSKENNTNISYIISLIIILITGLVMVFIVPTWQTPDEHVHLANLGLGFNNDDITNELLSEFGLDNNRIRGNYEQKVDFETWKQAMLDYKGDYNQSECLPRGINLSAVKHLPAAVGVMIGIMFHLSPIWVLQLGEITSLLFYVAVCALAIKLMPIKKEVLLMFMSFPMSVHQAASISYDAIVLSCSFLFIAYVFYMRYEKEKIGWLDLLFELFLLALVSYIKPPYVFMGFLIFAIPVDKLCLKFPKKNIDGEFVKKYKWPLIGASVVGIAAGFFILRNNFWIQLLGGMLLEFKRTVWLIMSTVYTWGSFLVTSSVGQFGWLDSSLPLWFAFVSYVVVLALALLENDGKYNSKYNMKAITRIVILATFGILVFMIMASMVNHTIMITMFGDENANQSYDIREALYYIGYIGGLQGRYFLPMLPLLFLALPELRFIKKNLNAKSWVVVAYQVVALVFSIVVLLKRYWII